MNVDVAPETDYCASAFERQAATQKLSSIAHYIMIGQADRAFWDGENRHAPPDRFTDTPRLKFLALPALHVKDSEDNLKQVPAQLRLFEAGGDGCSSFYSLLLGDVEIVWSDQDSDVIAYQADGNNIIDGYDAYIVNALADWLNSKRTVSYDPEKYHLEDGELVSNSDLDLTRKTTK